ncbi:uncharacterized protein [Parasteatoda tepidariorum]|uniref:uncharacterized protein n=1 Tax=Parasteatoda tepidariorum TaxID=114398 RepID=UPI0039BCE602
MKINLTLTIIVLTIVNGFNMSSSSGDIGDGEYFESCIKWIKCKLEDKDALDKYDKCQKLASDETITKMLKIMGDIANREWSDSEAAYNEFCNMDKDQQHEFFIHHLQQMLEEYSSTCADFMQVVSCKKMTEMTDCVIPLLNRLHGEKKC